MTFDEVKLQMAEDRKNGVYRISAELLTARCRLVQGKNLTCVVSDHYYPRMLGGGRWMYGIWMAQGIAWKRG